MLSPVDEIKSKLDMVDIVQEYFPLKQAGANFKACCPFHQEKTPSFMVSREKQIFHCFGCNEGGDMFTFLQKMENIEFPEALKILANKAGVQLKYQDPKVTNLKTRLLLIQEAAADWFSAQLWNSQAGQNALKYLKEERKLADETIKEWKIGYALDSWDALGNYLKTKNFTDQEISQSGLVVPKDRGGYYDRFRDRIMFTIEDHHGNTVGFTGRAMKKEETAKYVNSPQTLVYNKSEVIFGLGKAKQWIKNKDAVILVEGNMDVIASCQAGVKQAVAASGTALTKEQIGLLKRYTNNFIVCFDADSAGVGAAKRGIELAWGEEVNVRVAPIPAELGKDPDDLVRRDPRLWQDLAEKQTMTAMDYFFEMEFKHYQSDQIEIKKEIAKNLLNLILKLASPIEREFYLNRLAEKLRVPETVLRETIEKAKSRARFADESRRAQTKPAGTASAAGSGERKVDNRQAMLQRLLGLMLLYGEHIEYISANMPLAGFESGYRDVYKTIIIYYTKTRRGDWSMAGLTEFVKDNRVDLVDLFNPLLMLAEGELAELGSKDVSAEIRHMVYFFKKEEIKKELGQVSAVIKQAEKDLAAGGLSSEQVKPVRAELDQRLNQFQELMKEWKEIEKSQ